MNEKNLQKEKCTLSIKWNDDMQSITLTNSRGDTFTSFSEELQDFLSNAQSLPVTGTISEILKYWHTYSEDEIALIRNKVMPLLEPVTDGKTLDECKDEVARKYGHANWSTVKNKVRKGHFDVGDIIAFCDEANALFYAQQHTRGTDIIHFIEWMKDNYGIFLPDTAVQEYLKYGVIQPKEK